MSRVPLHRPTRALPPALPDQRVVLPAPPQTPQQQPGSGAGSWLSLLLPLMSTVSMAAYMVMYRKPLLIVLGVGFVLISVGATVAVRHQMTSASRQNKARQRARYLRYLAEVKQTARQVAGAQRLSAAWLHPSPERLWAVAERRRRVWERRGTDEDFLQVRVGQGRADLATPIQLGTRNDPMAEYDEPTHAAAQRVLDQVGKVGHQPALLDLARAGVVSLLGPVDRTRALARALLCQVAVLHAPDDVTVAVCTGGSPDWEWAKWLPHTHEAGAAGPAGVVPLVAARFEELADALEEALARAQTERTGRRTQQPGRTPAGHRLLVLLDSYDPAAAWARGPVATALLEAAGPELGITVVCLVDAEREEPTRTQVRARVGEDGSLRLEGRRGELYNRIEDAVADAPSPVLCELTARALAPLSLTEEAEQLLARTVTLPEMLGTPDVAAFDPAEGWLPPGDERLLRLPIGLSGDGDPVLLDLKEAAQGGMGPHGLVVGATGSGKSELLRTMVTGLAMTHSPELLSLVLVDFKGGATFAGVTGLPHVAGLITNLADDLSMVDRVRAALQGEQQRRQRMLRDAGNVDSLREYQLRREAGQPGLDGKPLEPLPYLLIVVDEFGELLSQRADFIDLFVQIGRVGRSLGMHLLLATQRLEEGRLRGLESHLSYRICLRTFSAAESRAVLGTPEAYELPSIPGSAYLKVDQSIYQRFRVAHISGPYRAPGERTAPTGPGAAVVPFELRTRPAEEPVPDPAPQVALPPGPTEMQVAVEHVCRFGQPVHQVWLPPLPAAIPLDSMLGPLADQPGRGHQAGLWPRVGRLAFPVGVIDLPLQQQQLALQFDFERTHGNLAVVGAPQTGKSTLLRTALLSAMLTHTPEEAQFYCLDFGGGSLRPLAAAPHVGAVAGRRDLPRARRVLAEIGRLVAAREQLFGELGIDAVAGFRTLRRAGKLPAGTRAADVFLVLDNWGAIRAELDDAEAAVVDLAARGLGVGVHVLLTANRWADVRTNLRDSIGGRLELRLNDPAESEVGRALSRQIPHGLPGRGAVPPGALYQALLPRLDGRESAADLGDAQQDTVAKIVAGWSGPAAPPVRMLPERVLRSAVDRAVAADAATAGAVGAAGDGVPIGLGELDLAPVSLHLGADDPHFLVLGDAASGKSTFLRTWMRGTAARRTAWQARFMVVDYRRALLDAVPPEYVGAYAGDATAAQAYTDQLIARLEERMPPPGITAARLRARDWWEGPELYLVVDDYDLVASGRQSPLARIADYVTQAREIGLHVVLARRVGGTGRAVMTDQLLSRLKDLGAGGLVLSGDHREGVLLGDQRAVQRPPGRGVLVRRGSAEALLQVAVPDEDEQG
ncbi:type VII secretion protein EccCa [Kitasatospora sp. NPDC058965]|uniref:type VII secretion protein EccCa n=1 Tax=Kitasatospora sp. NPDC058965 TaxID=3346682 RepID=UPI0036C24087